MIKVTKKEWCTATVIHEYTYILKGKEAREFLEEKDPAVKEDILFYETEYTFTADIDRINEVFDIDIEVEEIQPKCDVNFKAEP